MKTIKIFSLFALLAIAFTGCQEDNFGMGSGPAKVGGEIAFGGTAGYSNKKRTVYGDKWPDEKYTEIKWYVGDQVRIYCAEAEPISSGESTIQYCDYYVNNTLQAGENPKNDTQEETHFSTLSAIGGSGLKWGTTTSHTFYGVYPAPTQLSNNNADELSQTAAGKLKLEGNTLTGYLPNRQTPLKNETNFVQAIDGGYIVHPAMRYAYMVANTTANLSNSVQLSFDPIVTAVEITLVNNSEDKDNTGATELDIPNIKGFSVSNDNVICGDFTTNITSRENTVTSTGDTYKQIFIPAEISNLKFGESVTFTVFMMLDDASVNELKNLDVTIITASGQKTAKLNGKSNATIVYAKKKNFLSNVDLNLGVVNANLNATNWVEYIPDEVEGEAVMVKTLSIPGAGGAASYTKYASNPQYAQQSLTIEQQWNQGIRCFEFAVDLPGEGESFGEQDIICNGRTTGVSLKNAIDAVVTCLNNSPREFAMAIITYENLGGWAEGNNISRNPNNFMNGLKTFWNNYSSVTALYNPQTTTVASARGKLFCIARPTSAYYDDGPTIIENKSFGIVYNVKLSYNTDNLKITDTNNLHEHILIINGWGSLKDKWEARGYTGNIYRRGTKTGLPSNLDSSLPGRPFDASTLTDSWSDKDITKSNYSTQVEKCKQNTANFYYPTQLGTSTSITDKSAWVQEWARVSPENAEIVEIKETNATKKVYWAPTITEKELRIKQTLEDAIKKGDILYINSLCGFFIKADIVESYRPHAHTDRSLSYDLFDGGWKDRGFTEASKFSGMEGDIDTYAKYINNYFYKLLIDKASEIEAASYGMGIVLMDRVSNSAETDPAGYYIPQIIWSNNKFINE